jgi:hypothetical protein
MTFTTETQSNSVVHSTSMNPVQPTGVDIGNGAIKLVTSSGETRSLSYVYYHQDRDLCSGKGGVEYLEGDRQDLVGKFWIGGLSAYYHRPTSILRITDDKAGKVQLGLQCLLSTLSELPYQPTWDLAVVASVHDGKTLGKALKQALEGTHGVRLAGRVSKVTVRVLSILEEGTGAVINYQKSVDTTNAILYDLGNGTLIVSHFEGRKLTDRTYSQNGGVETLIDAIARHDSVRKQLLGEGQRHLIRAGIEKGDFKYGTQQPGWTFEDAYRAELPIWVQQVLTPMVKPTDAHRASATALIAVGGGAKLPGIETLLGKKGISVLGDPQWANARGLYQYAVHRLGQERIA